MLTKAETKTLIVRCVLLGENDSVLFFRQPVQVDGLEFSHWELPFGKLLDSDKNLEVAVSRIVYSKTGFRADKFRQIIKKSSLAHNTILHDHHKYFLVEKTEGQTFLDEHRPGRRSKGKPNMGKFQWIEPALLSCYAVRKETLTVLEQIFRKTT